jgi:hypothetical protein
MSQMPASVKVIHAALDETPDGDIILRGVVDHGSLAALSVDQYQREVLSDKKVQELMDPVKKGRVPDITLGMRGERYMGRGETIYLQDPVFIIDGLQRVTAALQLVAKGAGVPHLGIKVHFNTTEETERKMFQDLNLGQTKLSPNVTLRNAGKDAKVMDALYRLSGNKAFSLSDQICWQQYMRRNDRLTAATYVKVSAMLHSHAGPGRASEVLQIISGLEKIMANVGRETLVSNVKTFFEIIDQAWGIQRVAFRHSAPFLKATFMMELARVFSDHSTFWDEDRLNVDQATIKKLADFPIADPEVIRLSSSAGTAGNLLYMMFIEHINRGRRTRRLKRRRSIQDAYVEESQDDGGEE